MRKNVKSIVSVTRKNFILLGLVLGVVTFGVIAFTSSAQVTTAPAVAVEGDDPREPRSAKIPYQGPVAKSTISADAPEALVTFTGTTAGGPTWNRPTAGDPPSGLSGVGTAVPYSTLTFTVDISGTYVFQSTGTAPAGWDNYTFLYQTSFNPASQLTNILVGNDDNPTIGLSGFSRSLTTGTTYVLVVTGFANSNAGAWSTDISGPGTATLVGGGPCGPPVSQYSQGFEVDGVWSPTSTVNRVASGTNGITSKTGGFHGQVGNNSTHWGGYNSVFPPRGYTTSVAVYLNVAGGFTNDTRFDWISAINNPAGSHRRDFVFNAGYYDDAVAPGGGPRFVVSASNNSGRANSFPKNPARSPFVISATGWYTLVHRFYDAGAGVLAVELSILNSAGVAINSWTLSDPTDVIGSTVGGNRYGWFPNNEFTFLAIDDSQRSNASGCTLVVDDNLACPNAAFTTIQAGVNAAFANDTVQVCAGSYPEMVTVNKALTINGAQAGVDARTRPGTPALESVVSGNAGSTSFYITANDVTIDGFTAQGNTNPNLFGMGILMGAGTNGTDIINNIVQNNIIGISLANNSASNQATIRRNLIRDNNNAGPASGTGIYTDQYNAGGTLQNVLISDNRFSGHTNGGGQALGFSSDNPAQPSTNITISNNEFVNNGRAMYAFNLTNSTFANNLLTGASFAGSADLRLFEGINALNINCNTMYGGVGRGVRLSNIATGAPQCHIHSV